MFEKETKFYLTYDSTANSIQFKDVYKNRCLDNITSTSFIPFVSESEFCRTRKESLFSTGSDVSISDAVSCDAYCIDLVLFGTPLCLEEHFCNGYMYGIFCDHNNTYVSNQNICDNVDHCKDKTDELLCENTDPDLPTCRRNVFDFYFVPIYEFNRCGPFVVISIYPQLPKNMLPYCLYFEDQTNCSDPQRVGMFCEINGHMSTVSRQMVCNKDIPTDVILCDHALERLCVSSSVSCFVHKHRICDGKKDCHDNSDETSTICSNMTEIACERSTVGLGAVTFPLNWVGDGVPDCRSGDDEAENELATFGFDNTLTYEIKEESGACQDEVFLFIDGFIDLKELCDILDSCGNESKICKQSRSKSFSTTSFHRENYNYLTQCLPGLSKLNLYSKYICKVIPFQWPHTEVALSNYIEVTVAPNLPVDCTNVLGKAFVYLSCNGLCKSSGCPLQPHLESNSCIGQYPDRILAIADYSYLTFMIQEVRGSAVYRQNVFQCKNGRCVGFGKVCDLVNDCGDMSDEDDCNNQFRCESSGERIVWSMVCDGNVDCKDNSDEFNNDQCSTGRDTIKSGSVRVFAWVIASTTLISNLVTLPKKLYQLSKCKVGRSMSNVLFLILINISDLLIAVCIQAVVICEAIYGNNNYVLRWKQLDITYCSLIGTLSTTAKLTSLFSMTFLSISRFSVIKSGLLISSEINKNHILKIGLIVFMIVSAAFTISAVPILNAFEDYFVDDIVYSNDSSVFHGMLTKQKVSQILTGYYGRMRHNDKPLTWQFIRLLVSDIISKDHTDIQPIKLNVFDNDAVCLLNYFVTAQMPQRRYVLSILIVHACSLLVVILCCISIWNASKTSSCHLVVYPSQNVHINQRSALMQRKIMMIIATCILCWAPILILSGLHYNELLDAAPSHYVISLIITPINSLINPVISDDFLSTNIARGLEAVYKALLKKK